MAATNCSKVLSLHTSQFISYFFIFGRNGKLGECIGLALQGFGSGHVGCKGGFCEKLLEAVPMSDRANAGWLQDRPITSRV